DRHPNLDRYGRQGEEALSALALAPDLDYVRRSSDEAVGGTFSRTIPIETIMCSRHDRSLVPPGSEGETFYMYAFNTPVELAEGDW
ncbi:hypothetical protein OFC37_30560, partial [Escherichia coli]|nr:hypothetical protein [Escherichia coli]